MLSDNIRYYRKRKEMSQDELAEQLGVSRQSISLWETGQTQPTIDNIIALTRLFGITSDELLSDIPAAPTATQAAAVDLFAYCRDLAVKIGHLNGDYTIYQQPATRYGGYDNEYFSLSYWGDSNMVEFCLHCPLDETYSVNFYLRMRGGYRQKYEYLSSRYYRDTGESVRSASGTIDPAVVTDRYPLNCDEYKGSTQGQDDFMEESRVGLCDLIRCLKGFVAEEGLDIDFSAFGFVNF